MKIRVDKYTIIFGLILLVSFGLRFIQLDAVGYVTDEPVIITAGIKHFLNNEYPVSLYDMATPGGQWPIGLSVTTLVNRDFSAIKSFGIMDYVSIDLYPELLMGLEWSARLPGAILGFLSIIVVYLLVCELYGRRAGVISSALFAFNPVLIDYSRIALLEIYQIFYMLVALYFFYLSMSKKKHKNKYLVASSVFLGLTAAAKLNGLMLIPLFIIFSVITGVRVKKRKKELNIDLFEFAKNAIIIIFFSFLVLGVVFDFNFNTPYQVYNYYSGAGGTGMQFVLFNLLIDSLFFINPLVWFLLIIGVNSIVKDKNKGLNDYFAIFLIVLIFMSGFFEAHASIKRGIQYICLIFLIVGKVYSKKKLNKVIEYIPLIIILSNLILVLYFFPNTGLAKNVLCVSNECINNHNTRNYDARLVGEYLNTLEGAVIFDTVETTGLTMFYLQDYWNYMNGGVAKFNLGTCPTLDILKENGFTHVIDNNGCFNVLENDLNDCDYEVVKKNYYEIARVYDIRGC